MSIAAASGWEMAVPSIEGTAFVFWLSCCFRFAIRAAALARWPSLRAYFANSFRIVIAASTPSPICFTGSLYSSAVSTA